MDRLKHGLFDIESASQRVLERPVDPDAIDVLLQARTLNSLPPSPQLLAQRIMLYERAVELDPRSVRALVGLAEALIDSISIGSEDPSAPMKFRWADELTRRAELLRPDDAYVMYVRLYLLGREWRWCRGDSGGAEGNRDPPEYAWCTLLARYVSHARRKGG